MTLTYAAKIVLKKRMEELFAGDITAEQYLTSVKAIYQIDAQDQEDFLVDKGFTTEGARKHIHNLDKGQDIL